MRLRELSAADFRQRCREHRLPIRVGPLLLRVGTRLEELQRQLAFFYADHQVPAEPAITDFHVAMRQPRGFRQLLRPQVNFFLDAEKPFEPYPREQAFPLFEWGVNWCIATRAHQFLMLHSAVLERNGQALILAGIPGSGKSTLCAALSHRGWRMLSDEFGMIRPETGDIWALPKPIALKNQAIEVVREEIPEAVLGPLFRGTRKGDVVHVKPPRDSVEKQHQSAKPAWVVFPAYSKGSATILRHQGPDMGFARLSQNSFNYRTLGEDGFRGTAALVRQCGFRELVYSRLDEAVACLKDLVDHGRG